MVSLVDKTISLNDKVRPIVRFDVWFATPLGITTDLDEANKTCTDHDLDPEMNVRPVSVALDQDGRYEVLS